MNLINILRIIQKYTTKKTKKKMQVNIIHEPSKYVVIYKELYKTTWEIKQIWVLKGAAARGPFVDQTQSMDIFMAEPDYQRLGSSHFWAWKNGLKTGMYYLRTKPSADAIKITVDSSTMQYANKTECETCSA